MKHDDPKAPASLERDIREALEFERAAVFGPEEAKARVRGRVETTVGITAGASAPEVLVEDVIDALRRLGPVDVSELTGRQETIEFRLPPELTEGRGAERATAKV